MPDHLFNVQRIPNIGLCLKPEVFALNENCNFKKLKKGGELFQEEETVGINSRCKSEQLNGIKNK